MDFLATLFAFCALSAVANTQVAPNTSSPVTNNTTILEGGRNGGCPATEVVCNTINQDVHQQLRSIAPQLIGGLPDSIGSGACCGITEGWTQIVYLDMFNPSQQCPSAWEEASQPVRSCGRVASTGGSCDSVNFTTNGQSYSCVCGHLRGYQVGYNNAFHAYIFNSQANTINSYYVDGVSITYGSPRIHIWTLAIGRSGEETDASGCPCLNAGTAQYSSPPFVGQNYFRESGMAIHPPNGTAVSSEPLWDGEGCPAVAVSLTPHHTFAVHFPRQLQTILKYVFVDLQHPQTVKTSTLTSLRFTFSRTELEVWVSPVV